MKTVQFVILAAALTLTAASCTVEETSSSSTTTEPAQPAAPSALDQDAIFALVDEDADAVIGTEITITGVSWGVADHVGGKKGLELSNEKLEGFKQAPITCMFEADDDLSGTDKDATVVVKGKVTEARTSFGVLSVKLENCTIVK